jgi:hypothetical protein
MHKLAEYHEYAEECRRLAERMPEAGAHEARRGVGSSCSRRTYRYSLELIARCRLV